MTLSTEHLTAAQIRGSLVIIEGATHAFYDEIVEINGKTGRVIALEGDKAIILVFEGTRDFSLEQTTSRFTGRVMEIPLSIEMLGRCFNGMGLPTDGLGALPTPLRRDINGTAINPVQRVYPCKPMATGLSVIDGLITLVRGQKLPIFSADGLPHDAVATQIVTNLLEQSEADNEDTAVVFAAMGVGFDTAQFFRRAFEESGALARSVLFLNLANDPPAARIITPRLALTAAEYLAFDCGKHVLVILTDMTAYAEALREIASARGEIPGRRGYPGYLYSDLACLYERAGIIKGRPGSLTQIPILTMPGGDITHPIADLTGYITEGQIVLDTALHRRGIFPPVGVLPSLSRLMKDGIGTGKTRADHATLAHQLFAAYAEVDDARALLSIVGEDEMSEADKKRLAFGKAFEETFIHQANHERRSWAQTLDRAKALLAP